MVRKTRRHSVNYIIGKSRFSLLNSCNTCVFQYNLHSSLIYFPKQRIIKKFSPILMNTTKNEVEIYLLNIIIIFKESHTRRVCINIYTFLTRNSLASNFLSSNLPTTSPNKYMSRFFLPWPLVKTPYTRIKGEEREKSGPRPLVRTRFPL